MDRETVITHLQIIHTWAEFARERDLQFFSAKHLEDIAQWADEALSLLKEDCHNCKLECLLQRYDQLKEKYDKLLKEKEHKDRMFHALEDDWKRLKELLKEQEGQVRQWTKEIADNQLAHAPDELDRENWDYKKGIWDGLQIAWNIISEGR